MQTGSKGFPLVEMRGGIEVGRLRGACLEACWKEKAVAKERVQATHFFSVSAFQVCCVGGAC